MKKPRTCDESERIFNSVLKETLRAISGVMLQRFPGLECDEVELFLQVPDSESCAATANLTDDGKKALETYIQ